MSIHEDFIDVGCPAGSHRALSEADERKAAAALRQAICEQLQDRKADVEPFLAGDFAAYVRRMESEATWGGKVQLWQWYSVTQLSTCWRQLGEETSTRGRYLKLVGYQL